MDASSLPLACYWHASGLPLEDSVIRPRTAPPQAQCLGGGGLGSCLSGRHVAYCLARGPSGGLPMWAGLFLAAPVRFLRCLHCNRHCGGMRRHCDGTSGCGGTSARKAHRRRYDAPAPLAWDQGEMSSREIAHDSDDGVEQAARSCEPTATRAFGVTAIWMDRTFCYACCPPLLTLKDNLHSRCAAISDYPSRPSSPADRWLYLLIGPLNLLGWRAPRAASGAPEAHRHTTPASALKQAHRAGCRSGVPGCLIKAHRQIGVAAR